MNNDEWIGYRELKVILSSLFWCNKHRSSVNKMSKQEVYNFDIYIYNVNTINYKNVQNSKYLSNNSNIFQFTP